MKRAVFYVLGTLVLVLGWGPSLAAQETPDSPSTTSADLPQASKLPVDQAADFLGRWDLSMELGGNQVEMTLDLMDVEGKVGARLESTQGQRSITDIYRSQDVLELGFESNFGRLVLKARLEEDRLTGTFGDEGGNFSAPMAGTRAEDSGTARGTAPSAASSALFSGGRRRTEMRTDRGRVTVVYETLENGFDRPSRLAELKAGEVLGYTDSAAIKLRTDLSLKFGDTVLATENVAPGYPGVYGLWLKKVGDGWGLVFSHQADVWGSQHDPSQDAAEIPLRTAAGPGSQAMSIDLEETPQGGVLRLAWGELSWWAPFEVVDLP